MPVCMTERNLAAQLETTKESTDNVKAINDEEGVRRLYSFISSKETTWRVSWL